jgi:uncharacterized protein (TIGR02001 family)
MRKYLKLFIFAAVFKLMLPQMASAQTLEDDFQSGNSAPTFKLSGEVELLSHYVQDGLSQTDNSPALRGSFWFNFGPQFRLGLDGSNVSFENSDDHFNLNLNAELRIAFNQVSSATLRYSKNQYYKSGDRNGNTLGLQVNYLNYRVLYEQKSNWEGTDSRSTRYGFGNTMDIFGSWKWNSEVGYNTPNNDNFNAYFDARTGLGSKFSVIFLEGAVSATSSPDQFHGAGDIFVILSASTHF